MQTKPILQTSVPHLPWRSPASDRMPGVQPLDPPDWVRIDEAYGGQMALREDLLNYQRGQVLALEEGAHPAAELLLSDVLSQLADHPAFDIGAKSVRCPDGRRVGIARDDPLGTVGRLVQEDVCLLQKRGAEHVLVGAVLCFPASWTLSEKFGRPLGRIHRPVSAYDDGMARRVQRLFDAARAGQVLWRSNAMAYADPSLFQPRREADGHRHEVATAEYMRSEFQTIRLLADNATVAFSIHTYVMVRSGLTEADQLALEERGAHAGARP